MKLINFIVYSFLLVSCKQKKIIITIEKLKEQSLIIYYNKLGYRELEFDKMGNYIINFDSTNIINTSTIYKDIIHMRSVWCFRQSDSKCFEEEYELNQLGYEVNEFSHFTSDTTNKNKYLDPYVEIIISKIK